MRGFIGVTDLGWFDQLPAAQNAGQPPVEVNFWKPSERLFKALQPGEPFFFRLKSPANAIGGFAVFQRATVWPAWLAWEAFDCEDGVDYLGRRVQETSSRGLIQHDRFAESLGIRPWRNVESNVNSPALGVPAANGERFRK